jgi:hypothetical protein
MEGIERTNPCRGPSRTEFYGRPKREKAVSKEETKEKYDLRGNEECHTKFEARLNLQSVLTLKSSFYHDSIESLC